MTNVSQATQAVIGQGAYLTLHYRLASEQGEDIVSTFADNPATLQLGAGQLAPFLEDCLLGLAEGAHTVFHLTPEQAFGARNPELLRRLSRETLAQNSTPHEQYAIGDLVEFAAPGGGRFAGMLCEIDEESALFDFNHPLAGQNVQFEVKIIGVL
ncbi:FKBP-type peptidyl-prolyl cis-trans isomerase [uncultured Oxalicibacterium sp.]|uniref:FKBP-type peptidyl-prolyl cis-trans isomerase n=1 Tax=uncultured Oxalicibacterium sp. TaxID=1168540 RepID=UPI0025F82BC5|nr:FKBP-type peptidyl-prolyl cis-trans isomerase [uncultured Oxalicibacterium sp.]